MKLKDYIRQFTLDQTIQIEESEDLQFVALKKAWNQIKNIDNDMDFLRNAFLSLIIQNALISYQLSKTGEFWREEFAYNMIKYFQDGKFDNFVWWQRLLSDCRGNCRLRDMKIIRLHKFFDKLSGLRPYEYIYNMSGLLDILSSAMDQSRDAKTLVFAIKMFGYGARIIEQRYIVYPSDINIPVDSRLTKIYELDTGEKSAKPKQIQQYFRALSEETQIPLMHLDTLLWVRYWKEI